MAMAIGPASELRLTEGLVQSNRAAAVQCRCSAKISETPQVRRHSHFKAKGRRKKVESDLPFWLSPFTFAFLLGPPPNIRHAAKE